MKHGILYGVGIGPGDPELLTLKAARILSECDLLALPDKGNGARTAYDIACAAVPSLKEKPLLPLTLPMLPDRAAEALLSRLNEGQTVAFVTLGDPTIYSTYLYLHRRVLEAGGDARLIPGVPSFCAAAAAMGVGLVEGDEPLHIGPAPYEGVDEALGWRGVKVLMKAGRATPGVLDSLRRADLYRGAWAVECCGMPGERLYRSLDELEAQPGYFTVFVAK
ncbi:MAG: precorrin-2 C(20)-methyltransferase [Oscillospiraceae bacterium]